VFFIKHLFTKARIAAADKKYDNYAFVDAIKPMKESQRKVINRLICSKNWKCLLLYGTRKSSTVVWRIICNDYWGRTSLLLSLCPISSFIDDKADQIMEKFDKMSGNDSRGELLQKNETIWMPYTILKV
jgi:hypothetical protein